MQVVILGCGYTGRRVALLLARRGVQVLATARDASTLSDLPPLGIEIASFDASLDPIPVVQITPGAAVLCSIPPIETPAGPIDRTPKILGALNPPPARVEYLSTTGVYGSTRDVNESTSPNPQTPRDHLRLAAEREVARGPWSFMILRPAAIYGSDRGVHISIAKGMYRLAGKGDNYVSRIHVEDLATHCVAALESAHQGAWPVADDHPCRSAEIADYCAKQLGVALPPSASPDELHETRRADRRVDGRAVRRLLGIDLRYPSYKTGLFTST